MEKSRRKRRSRAGVVSRVLSLILLVAGGAALAAVGSGTRAFFVPTASMEPTLLRGDQFRADVSWAPRHDPKRGEIWVFNNPNPDPMGGDEVLVKRVIGLPGEKIEVAKGKVLVNGKALSEPYLKQPPRYKTPPRKLQKDEYWMLGDNRNRSEDSHRWGPLKRGAFIGKAIVRFWPPDRIRIF